MNRRRNLWFSLTLATCLTSADAQDFNALQSLWKDTMRAVKDHEVDRANLLFDDFNRKTRAYLATHSLNWDLKYLVGTLNCQFTAARAKGADLLKDMLQNDRDLGAEARTEVARVIEACHAAGSELSTPASYDSMRVDEFAHLQKPGVRGDTKGGYLDLRLQESTSSTEPVPMAEAALLARRVPASEPVRALEAAKARLGTRYGAVVGGFAVVVHPDGDDVASIKLAQQIGACLTRYQAPLHAEFGMLAPADMITVYESKWVDEVYEDADHLHGLRLPGGVVAYSVQQDMSLVGIAGPNVCGSMAHELVHLTIRASFPMSPPWLEEGLASAVALAEPTPDRFRFQRGWRDGRLREEWKLRPRIGELLELSWADFSPNGHADMHRAAAVQAMAAVFIRYLDERGKLRDVYFAARNQSFNADPTPSLGYRQIVEAQLGKTSEQIDQDFQTWFEQRHGVAVRSPTDSFDEQCTVQASPMQQQGCRR